MWHDITFWQSRKQYGPLNFFSSCLFSAPNFLPKLGMVILPFSIPSARPGKLRGFWNPLLCLWTAKIQIILREASPHVTTMNFPYCQWWWEDFLLDISQAVAVMEYKCEERNVLNEQWEPADLSAKVDSFQHFQT